MARIRCPGVRGIASGGGSKFDGDVNDAEYRSFPSGSQKGVGHTQDENVDSRYRDSESREFDGYGVPGLLIAVGFAAELFLTTS